MFTPVRPEKSQQPKLFSQLIIYLFYKLNRYTFRYNLTTSRVNEFLSLTIFLIIRGKFSETPRKMRGKALFPEFVPL